VKINIIIVSQKPEAWVTQATNEYIKRFSKEINFNIIEIPLALRSKEKNLSQTQIDKYKEIEYLNISKYIKNGYNIALEIKAKILSTEELAERLREFQHSNPNINIIIGGPHGLHPELLAKCQEKWSLSKLTLPHNLVRVIITEQLYRGWTILKNHPYHK